MKPISQVRAKQRRGESLTAEEQRIARDYERDHRRGRRVMILVDSAEQREELREMASAKGEGLAPWLFSHALRSIHAAPVDPHDHEALQKQVDGLLTENRALATKVGEDQAELSQLRYKVAEYAEEFVRIANHLEALDGLD